MGKITTSELEEMIRNKFLEKGVSENEISEDVLNSISLKIKEEVNKDKPVENISNTDIKDNSNELPIEKNIQPTESQPIYKSEEVSYRDGELDERERRLAEKEAELIRKEQELLTKEKEMEYNPELPNNIDNMGCEDFFIFDENQISVGAEKLSNTEFNLVNAPEEKTTMRNIWLKDGRKEANVFKVKFEKIGCIKFDPFEGVSTFENHNSQEEEINSPLDFEATKRAENPIDDYSDEDLRIVDIENKDSNINNNMLDAIEPIKNVAQPLIKTDEIEQELQKNNSEDFFNNNHIENNEFELERKIENMIKKYFQKMI
jgi:hypothetical protein